MKVTGTFELSKILEVKTKDSFYQDIKETSVGLSLPRNHHVRLRNSGPRISHPSPDWSSSGLTPCGCLCPRPVSTDLPRQWTRDSLLSVRPGSPETSPWSLGFFPPVTRPVVPGRRRRVRTCVESGPSPLHSDPPLSTSTWTTSPGRVGSGRPRGPRSVWV